MSEFLNSSDKPFACLLTNKKHDSIGLKVSQWVEFPTTPEKLQEAFDSIFVESSSEIILDKSRFNVKNLEKVKFAPDEDLNKINYFAQRLTELDDFLLDRFENISMLDEIRDLDDLICLTDEACLNGVTIFEDVVDDEDLGHYLIETLEYEENVNNDFDYKTYGQDYRLEDGGLFCELGYIENSSVHLNARVLEEIEPTLVKGGLCVINTATVQDLASNSKEQLEMLVDMGHTSTDTNNVHAEQKQIKSKSR